MNRTGTKHSVKGRVNRGLSTPRNRGKVRRLARNPLKGKLGDALHAVMCGAGRNLRLILTALRLLCARFGLSIQAIIAAMLAVPL